MGNLIDHTGQRFGRLVVIELKGFEKGGQATWLCRCDCGNQSVVIGSNLRRGTTTSCGCLRDELRIVHGKYHTRLHNVWKLMKRRCSNPNDKRYHRYGGRGIDVCDEWRNDFGAFYAWATANGYDENAKYGECTLDRIDNDKGYSPDNCRWVDIKTQNNNRSPKRRVKESEGN